MKPGIIIIIVALVLAMAVGANACGVTTPSRLPAPSNPESESRIAELEAEIRQLESDNQRLLTENQELRSNLVEITSMLESIQGEIPDILIMVTEIQNASSDLAAFLEGLPSLPTPPLGLDSISTVNDVITKAIFLRTILKKLPPPPPLIAPAEWYELDEMKDEFIRMTEWMEGLEDLPEFLNIAGDLDDSRYQEIAHLENINATMDNIKSIPEELTIKCEAIP